MTEVEKLYENAGIEKEFEKPAECTKNPYITCNGCMLYDDKKGKCNNRKEYPPFTAEKQIELIKWIFKSDYYITYSFWGNKYGYNVQYEDKDELIEDENFENSLAKVINFIWNFITEEEKQQIKEILKQ